MQIVSVVPLDKRRSKVLTDEDFAFALYKGELKKYCVEEGRELSREQYEVILQEALLPRAKERALYLLKTRDRTELEIRRKLQDGYFPKEAMEYAVNFLKSYGFVDDINYGRRYIRANSDKKSKRQIQFELQQKGLDKETVRELLEEGDVSEDDQIISFLERKGYDREAALPKERAKMASALVRKGFSYDTVCRIMGEYFDNGE